jgi:hypothetical protein
MHARDSHLTITCASSLTKRLDAELGYKRMLLYHWRTLYSRRARFGWWPGCPVWLHSTWQRWGWRRAACAPGSHRELPGSQTYSDTA